MYKLLAKTDFFLEITTFVIYFVVLIGIALFSFRKQKSDADFVLGDRSLNFWLTALSAHASDMGSWLFLGYPALIFTSGVISTWAAIGLTLFMFLNWHFIAPKIRTVTEQTNSLTISSYFENRFGDKSGSLRIISAAMSFLFFTIYISSGIVGMGVLVDSLFGINYTLGISLGLFIVMLYVFVGGYRTVAWIDLFQGFFLLAVVIVIAILLLLKVGSMEQVLAKVSAKGLSTSLFPDFSPKTLATIFLTVCGWGLGYLGQPHIITKFMGIKKVSEMSKAKYLGISWQAIALTSVTFIGLIGIYLFPEGLSDPQEVILNIVKATLPAFFAGLVLCAILAATTNVMAAQILVVASNLSEDFYKRIFRREASSKELLWVSRMSVVFVSLIGYAIAYFKISTIYKLVLYAWSGLGASFGPLILLSLYRKELNKYGAFAGILVGGISSAIWPYLNHLFSWDVMPLVPAFALSLITIEGVSFYAKKRFSLQEEP